MKLKKTDQLMKIAEEYGDLVGGEKKFLELYDQAHKDRYSFLYLKLSENPAEAYIRFETKIYPPSNTPAPELEITEEE